MAAQVRDPLVLVLLAAAVLTTATGDWTNTCVIMLVVVVNTAVGVSQEVKADRAITALSEAHRPGGPGPAVGLQTSSCDLHAEPACPSYGRS
jgi:magnesium-transporting ATPase (P-type)